MHWMITNVRFQTLLQLSDNTDVKLSFCCGRKVVK